MYFTSVTRFSPEHGRMLPYYKIKESFRDALGRVHTRVMHTPGYLPDLCCDEIVQIRRGLTYLMEQSTLIPGQPTLFSTDPRTGYSEKVCAYVDKFWEAIKSGGKIDAARDSYDKAERKARRLIDVSTIKHTDAREVGAENVCLQAIRELQIDQFLRIMEENSAAMELLTGHFGDMPTQREVYAAAPSLHALKDKLERHLCARTDSLFNITNRLILYDLTNFYFEGSKRTSTKAKFGRSKEKRSDCRLLVLALAINTEVFIRYSSILAGNTADPESLRSMVDGIIARNPVPPHPGQKVMVVIDAGIATEQNLSLLKERGYNYLCVSRTKPKGCALKALLHTPSYRKKHCVPPSPLVFRESGTQATSSRRTTVNAPAADGR